MSAEDIDTNAPLEGREWHTYEVSISCVVENEAAQEKVVAALKKVAGQAIKSLEGMQVAVLYAGCPKVRKKLTDE